MLDMEYVNDLTCPDGSTPANCDLNNCDTGCPTGQELVNDVCVDECASDEERNSEGTCVKKTTTTTPELPSFIPRSALNVMKQDKPELVNIDYLYDIGGPSIFAPNLIGMDGDEEDDEKILGKVLDGNPYGTRAKKGGIIHQENAVDEIVRLLRGK